MIMTKGSNNYTMRNFLEKCIKNNCGLKYLQEKSLTKNKNTRQTRSGNFTNYLYALISVPGFSIHSHMQRDYEMGEFGCLLGLTLFLPIFMH